MGLLAWLNNAPNHGAAWHAFAVKAFVPAEVAAAAGCGPGTTLQLALADTTVSSVQ